MIPTLFASGGLNVEVAAQEIFKIGDFSVTNSLATGIIGWLILFVIMIYVGSAVKHGRYNRFVGMIQWVFEGLISQINEVIPDKKLARKVTPLVITMFFLILVNYWLSVLPGLDTVFINHVPILRSPTADLNFVFGLAIVTVVTVQFYAVKYLGAFGNANRYFKNPFKDPIGSFEGLLELIGEVSRGGSLALRLFGNAFAGETLLIVIAVLSGFFATVALPIFMIFELLIGFIQAYVFFVLTLIFISLAVSHGHDDKKHSQSDDLKSNYQLE